MCVGGGGGAAEEEVALHEVFVVAGWGFRKHEGFTMSARGCLSPSIVHADHHVLVALITTNCSCWQMGPGAPTSPPLHSPPPPTVPVPVVAVLVVAGAAHVQ